MAMKHVGNIWVGEIAVLSDDPDSFFLFNQNSVFPAALVFWRWLSVSRQDLKLNIVNVKRVKHFGGVGNFPDFDVAQLHGLIYPVDVHALAVNGHAAKQWHFESKFTGLGGLAFLKAHDSGQSVGRGGNGASRGRFNINS